MNHFSPQSTLGAVLSVPQARALLQHGIPWLTDLQVAVEHPEFPIGGLLGITLGWDNPARAELLAELAELEDPTVLPVRRAARPLAAPTLEQQARARLSAPVSARCYEPVEVTVTIPGAGALLRDVEIAGSVTLTATLVDVDAADVESAGPGADTGDTTGGSRIRTSVRVFYRRGDELAARFLPEVSGHWRLRVDGIAAVAPLEAEVDVHPAGIGEHGPVRVVAGHFAHADGLPFTPLGTTAYAWIHQGADMRRRTLETLASSGFNKLRMCIFPKHYDYNHADPESVPFRSTGPGEREWDWDAFDADFFDRLEQCVRELGHLGIIADLILFHPYDRWGFAEMTPDVDDAYLRHVVRRLAAFPNVWWSMANEYELLTTKRLSDWDRLGRIVVEEDPVGHPIGVHNIFEPFDASADWVSHVSFQGGGYEMGRKVDELRNRFGKPVVIDEYGYEGNLEHEWGNLTAEEELRRFWEGIIRGAGMTHGETYFHEEGIWWAHGGVLRGESWKRIAFLRRLIQEAPRGRLLPAPPGLGTKTAVDGDDYMLTYFGGAQPYRSAVTVPQGRTAAIDVIDTWNMTIEQVATGASGSVEVALPSRPWMAVRVRCD
ncbi:MULTISPECIES: DUF5605 domain-containing protein [unclassified Actinomyces]|uniref:DUF5605 domain-containing protein n=1 Tax=unclassified Actinomyces TaxID=2609248 RepID=UPI000D594169|nr:MULTISPECIES: DUF5605 domain-containing protein [unclassified Actinomyces]RAX21405.1 DUF4038 domain-containing protein [Actinomyces sp. Z3]